MKYLLSLVVCCSSFLSYSATCEKQSDALIASYQINNTFKEKAQPQQTLVIARQGISVVQELSLTKETAKEHINIAEMWHLTKNNSITLTRYFRQDQRGIEYQANEINGQQSWQQKYQLLDDAFIHSMTLINNRQTDCLSEETYQLTRNNITYQLTWLPQVKLVKSLTVTGDKVSRRIELTQLNQESTKVQAFFNELANYQTTDYTDIGDSESDPFFAKMINQGFIEHHHEGFYNSNGEAISAAH